MSAGVGTGSMRAWCVEQGGVEAGWRHCLGVERLRGSGRGPGQEPVGGSEVWTEGWIWTLFLGRRSGKFLSSVRKLVY